jgi:hypothetical protein
MDCDTVLEARVVDEFRFQVVFVPIFGQAFEAQSTVSQCVWSPATCSLWFRVISASRHVKFVKGMENIVLV